MWVDHISNGLLDYAFKRSEVDRCLLIKGDLLFCLCVKDAEVDPCLLIKGKLLFCLCVDDAICLAPNKKDADKLIADLEHRGYILTDEGPLSAYLGNQVDCLAGK